MDESTIDVGRLIEAGRDLMRHGMDHPWYAALRRDLRDRIDAVRGKFEPLHRKGSPRKYSDEQIRKAILLVREGLSGVEAARLTGIDKTTVHRAVASAEAIGWP